jgi:hypothetical protein
MSQGVTFSAFFCLQIFFKDGGIQRGVTRFCAQQAFKHLKTDSQQEQMFAVGVILANDNSASVFRGSYR